MAFMVEGHVALLVKICAVQGVDDYSLAQFEGEMVECRHHGVVLESELEFPAARRR